MDILSLVAAFGGGAFGAAIGALPAFILTGVVAVCGAAITLAGGTDVVVGNVAFGSFLGPHIAFAGGVAAAAFAANKVKVSASGNVGSSDVEVLVEPKISSGTDILYSLNGLGDSKVLLVGGIFGCLGFLCNYLYSGVLNLQTDTVAMTVATLGIITRLTLGKTGLIGKYSGKEPRVYFSRGKQLVYNIVLGAIIGLMVGYIAIVLKDAGVSEEALSAFPVLCFGISAVSLIFAQTGSASPTTHHITLPAANAAILSGNPLVGVIVAIICSLLGDFMLNTFNSHCDSHIDPPACTIFIMTFIILFIF